MLDFSNSTHHPRKIFTWRRLVSREDAPMLWVLYATFLCVTLDILFWGDLHKLSVVSRAIMSGSWFLVIVLATFFDALVEYWRRIAFVNWILLLGMGIIILATQYAVKDAPQSFLLCLIAIVAAAKFPTKPALVFNLFLLCLLVSLLSAFSYVSDYGVLAVLGMTALPHLGGFGLGVGIKQIRDQTAQFQHEKQRAEEITLEIEAASEKLIAAQATERALAVNEERAALAREIHDGLGHHLIALHVQLEAAEKLLKVDRMRAREILAVCVEQAEAASSEVRRTFGQGDISPLGDMSLEESIRKLVRDADEVSSIKVHFECSGDPTHLEPDLEKTLFRAAQEGLTNVRKHAVDAENVRVVIKYSSDAVALSVWDDGALCAAPNTPAGFGLRGLLERVTQLGGTLGTEPGPKGGYQLSLRIPLIEER